MQPNGRNAATRAYVPLRKKIKSRDTREETNFVAPYHQSAAAAVVHRSDDDGSAVADAPQEATWTRMEHGIALDGDDAPHAVRSFEKMNLPQDAIQYVVVLYTRTRLCGL